VLESDAVYRSVLHSVLQRVAVCCSRLQRVDVCFDVLQCLPICELSFCCPSLMHTLIFAWHEQSESFGVSGLRVAVCCSVLQCVVVFADLPIWV